MRREHDFYETAPWQTRALIANQPMVGTVLEPCVGDHSIANELRAAGLRVLTNDIDPQREADFHFDASDPALYEAVERYAGRPVDWVVTNPPYKMPTCRDIVSLAVERADMGVAMMLRISFREPTGSINPRGPFLAAHPIARALTLPRYSFTGNGKSDSATTEWDIWLRPNAPGWELRPLLSLYLAETLYAEPLAADPSLIMRAERLGELQ